MTARNKRPNKQPSAWIDHLSKDGDVIVGIESDDKSLTFDGHYICLFPRAENEKDNDKAQKRAEAVLSFMRGERQIKR